MDADGRHFRFGQPSPELPSGLVLDKSSAYTIALEDRDRLRGGEEKSAFHVQADAAPT